MSEKLVSSLKSSNKMMMKFMQDFSDEFPYDKYPMNSKDNKGDDELLKDVNQRLKIQKEIILNISKSFEESIFNAEKSLEK